MYSINLNDLSSELLYENIVAVLHAATTDKDITEKQLQEIVKQYLFDTYQATLVDEDNISFTDENKYTLFLLKFS